MTATSCGDDGGAAHGSLLAAAAAPHPNDSDDFFVSGPLTVMCMRLN